MAPINVLFYSVTEIQQQKQKTVNCPLKSPIEHRLLITLVVKEWEHDASSYDVSVLWTTHAKI
jgi:hypothetical protein